MPGKVVGERGQASELLDVVDAGREPGGEPLARDVRGDQAGDPALVPPGHRVHGVVALVEDDRAAGKVVVLER